MPLRPYYFAVLFFTPWMVNAQNTPVKPVNDQELRDCLFAEQEGLTKFNTLEQRAAELKGTEAILTERRTALQSRQQGMEKRTPNQSEVDELNKMVSVFNEQSDQLNADKAKFEQDVRQNEEWMNTVLKPACGNIVNKPIPVVTSFYACGFDQQGDLGNVPHCKSLPNLAALKKCVSNAGSKSKAQEICNAQE